MPSLPEPVHFSTAHSGAMAAFALCGESPLGVDIEVVRELPDLPTLVGAVLSEREQAKWRSLPKARRLHAFFDVWTRKEAFLKGTGQGLQKPPGEIDVPLDSCGPDQALSVCDLGLEVPEWSLRSLSAGDLALALAVSRPPTRVRCWEGWPGSQ
jgi:4'-phosphopantetheinyl transferase